MYASCISLLRIRRVRLFFLYKSPSKWRLQWRPYSDPFQGSPRTHPKWMRTRQKMTGAPVTRLRKRDIQATLSISNNFFEHNSFAYHFAFYISNFLYTCKQLQSIFRNKNKFAYHFYFYISNFIFAQANVR